MLRAQYCASKRKDKASKRKKKAIRREIRIGEYEKRYSTFDSCFSRVKIGMDRESERCCMPSEKKKAITYTLAPVADIYTLEDIFTFVNSFTSTSTTTGR